MYIYIPYAKKMTFCLRKSIFYYVYNNLKSINLKKDKRLKLHAIRTVLKKHTKL